MSQDHSHICGKDERFLKNLFQAHPHIRRDHPQLSFISRDERTTPTSVGKNEGIVNKLLRLRDHPHPTWGIHRNLTLICHYTRRITPTHVGKTKASDYLKQYSQDYPHTCGEDTSKTLS